MPTGAVEMGMKEEYRDGTNLLLLGEVVPHAGQEPGQLALRQLRPLLLQLLPLLLREDEHGRDGPLGLL